MDARLSPRGAAAISGGALLVAYVATLAPTVTLWDSGEFLAAIHSLGVPHPPGTPLFVFAARAWSMVLGWLPFAVAVNLASAACTAGAAAIMAGLMTRWTGRAAAGVAGALAGGGMAAVWQSATETEVYAYATLLIAVALLLADRAGTRWSVRHRVAIAFCFGLAVPLHISALVAGPAIILLAATDRSAAVSIRAALAPLAAWCVAVGLGTVRPLPVMVGVLLALAAWLAPDGNDSGEARWGAFGSLAMVVLGASFVLVMLVRARHDPTINEGSATSWQALVDIVARRQYDVPPPWPRRAPFWLQLGNVIQYTDWQVAAGLSDAPGISPVRTPITVAFVLLGIVGSAWHRRRDERSWKAMTLLFLCATVGVVIVLNLRAGPSFGIGILPPDAMHEARERDYFFSLAFLVAGLWCGCGLVALSDRLARSVTRPPASATRPDARLGARPQARPLARAVMLLALLPLALNWRAVDRRRAPDAVLARELAVELLAHLPERAVLVVAGDNDSFPLWYVQEVEGLRRDVTTVTIPLLGATWYRTELARRHDLLSERVAAEWRGLEPTLAAIGDGARARRRPLHVAVSVSSDDRRAVAPGKGWRLVGMSYAASIALIADSGRGDAAPVIDSTAIALSRIESAGRRRAVGGKTASAPAARDGTGRYVQRLLDCPAAALARARGVNSSPPGLLESTCNFR
ncbi:MAG: DUF2723 domain-containing protein [Gemmatimonadaceae bacterium]|nr:DUF2723 domain-containing protein [Gemmatimonadaceae bacterium]